MDILTELIAWRNAEAKRRGVEYFRILPDKSLKEIASVLPTTKESLCSISGIKDLKYAQYGKDILRIVSGSTPLNQEEIYPDVQNREETIYSVGEYIDSINTRIASMQSCVRGEVTSVQIRGSAVYFSIQDKDMGASLALFMWIRAYESCGVSLAPGLEIIVLGKPEVYKKYGKFSVQAENIQLSGEGQVRAAYIKLKEQLLQEGVFDQSIKRALSSPPKDIILITSRTGAVLHDFMSNIMQRGIRIRLIDSKVEGPGAISELLYALQRAQAVRPDCIVLIRGGGSMESLQPFNDERLVRAVRKSTAPVLCSIGHDTDVPLVQLASDITRSTPSLIAVYINTLWAEYGHEIDDIFLRIEHQFQNTLNAHQYQVQTYSHQLIEHLSIPEKKLQVATQLLTSFFYRAHTSITYLHQIIETLQSRMRSNVNMQLEQCSHRLEQVKTILDAHDPSAIIKRGFSLVYREGKILSSVHGVSPGDTVHMTLNDGMIESVVTHKTHTHEKENEHKK